MSAPLLLKGLRFFGPHESEADDLNDALGQVFWAVSDNTWCPEQLFDADGRKLMDRDELVKAAFRFAEQEGWY